MDSVTLAEMLRRDHEEWAALVAVLDARPTGAVHDPESPSWQARDVYSHFTRWIHRSTDELEARADGRTLARLEGSDDEINARWQGEDARLTLDEARSRAQAAFDRRVAVVRAVAKDRWHDGLAAIVYADGYEHIAAHRRYIEAAGGIP